MSDQNEGDIHESDGEFEKEDGDSGEEAIDHHEGVAVESTEGTEAEKYEDFFVMEEFELEHEYEIYEDGEGEDEGEGEEEKSVMEEEIDPAAPYDFSDSKEALKTPFELSPEQLAEVDKLWALFQDVTPAYTDIDGFVTPTELVYLLKCLLLMTYTPEQMQELIDYCVVPPHPDYHIRYEHFLKMVTIRQRDMPMEEELRAALQSYDPENSGLLDRENFRTMMTDYGIKMKPKAVAKFIREVDIMNDGTLGIEDIVGTLCIDLNREDIVNLQNQINPPPSVHSIDHLLPN